MIAIFNSSAVYKGLGIAVKLEPVAGDNQEITGGNQSPLSVCCMLLPGPRIHYRNKAVLEPRVACFRDHILLQ